jgi:hypothetical protein
MEIGLKPFGIAVNFKMKGNGIAATASEGSKQMLPKWRSCFIIESFNKGTI